MQDLKVNGSLVLCSIVLRRIVFTKAAASTWGTGADNAGTAPVTEMVPMLDIAVAH